MYFSNCLILAMKKLLHPLIHLQSGTCETQANTPSLAVAAAHGNAHEESSINVCRNVALVNECSPAMVGLTSATNGVKAHVYDSHDPLSGGTSDSIVVTPAAITLI